MKKILIGILLCFMFVPAVHAETFTETDVVDTVIEIRLSDTGVSITVRSRTVDAFGNGVRGISRDITSTYNTGELTAINAILTKGRDEIKIQANIP